MLDQVHLLAAVRALDELGRRAETDPLRQLELFGHQPQFLASEAPIAMYCGANRSGKSTALAALVSSFARTGHMTPRPASGGPGIWLYDRAVSCWVVGLTHPLLRETFIPLVLDNGFVSPSQGHPPLIPASEIEFYHLAENICKLKNGSLIAFKSADAPARVFQAAARDLIAFDEIPPREVWQECAIRIGGQRGSGLKLRVAATLLPEYGGVQASWAWHELIQPWQAGMRPDLEVWTSSIYDNPHLPIAEVERLERSFPPGTPEHDIRILGKLIPGVTGVLAYPMFRRGIHVSDAIGPHTIRPNLPLYIGMDFNVHPMAAVVGQQRGVGDELQVEVLDEVYLAPGTIPDLVAELRRRYPAHGAELRLYPDASGQARNVQTGVSDHAVLMDAWAGYPAPVRLLVGVTNPPVLERLNAVNRLLRDGRGAVRLRVAGGHCEELVKDFEGVQRDPKSIVRKSSRPGDPYRMRTHVADALGYWVAYEAPLPTFAAMGRSRVRRIDSPQYAGFGAQRGATLPRRIAGWPRRR